MSHWPELIKCTYPAARVSGNYGVYLLCLVKIRVTLLSKKLRVDIDRQLVVPAMNS